jgi:hypothetical protein
MHTLKVVHVENNTRRHCVDFAILLVANAHFEGPKRYLQFKNKDFSCEKTL